MKGKQHQAIQIKLMILFIVAFQILYSDAISYSQASGKNENKLDVADNQNSEREKPPIVDHFACSDYCPGPKEQYMVKIYQGITNDEECRKLGGRPATYVGWGIFHICIAE